MTLQGARVAGPPCQPPSPTATPATAGAPRSRSEALTLVLFLAAYAAVGAVGVGCGLGPAHLPVIAALSAIGTAGLTIARAGWYLAHAGALFTATLLVSTLVHVAPRAGAGLALGTVAQATLLAMFLRPRRPTVGLLDRCHTAIAFLVTGLASSAVGASVTAAVSIGTKGIDGPRWTMSLARAGASMVAVLTLAPLLLAWLDRPARAGVAWVELATWGAALALTAYLGFEHSQFEHSHSAPLVFPYLPLVVLILAAMRLGTPGALGLSAIIVPLSLWFTAQGRGPFADMNTSLLGTVLAVELYAFTAVGASWLIASLHNEATTASERLRFEAMHDPLTRLANRHLLMDRLQLALHDLDRRPGGVAVLYLDLDEFKSINDTLGHDAGDAVLEEVAARLATCVRAPDTVARLGGDEFAVVCTRVSDDDDAMGVARRIGAALDGGITLPGLDHTVTASIGVTVTRSASADPEALLHEADTALYRAKRLGRHGHEIYQERTAGGVRVPEVPVVDLTAAKLRH